MSLARLITFIILSVSFSSCGFLKRNTIGLFQETATENVASQEVDSELPEPNLPTHTSRVEIEKLDKGLPDKSPVEIVWPIPKDPVDGFILRYGKSRDDLKNSKKINSSEVEKFDSEEHGFVYRYELKDIPTKETFYVSISAFKGAVESRPSEVFEILAESR